MGRAELVLAILALVALGFASVIGVWAYIRALREIVSGAISHTALLLIYASGLMGVAELLAWMVGVDQ